jgi:hypothetical protein
LPSARLALEVAQDDDGPVALGQPVQLQVEQRHHLGPEFLLDYFGFGHCFDLPLPELSPGPCRLDLQRRVAGDPVQPAGQQLPRGDGAGLSRQDKEDDLEGVLAVLVVVEHALADGPDHRPMPAHQRREGCLIAAGHELFEEFLVAAGTGHLGHHPVAQVLYDPVDVADRHCLPSSAAVVYL